MPRIRLERYSPPEDQKDVQTQQQPPESASVTEQDAISLPTFAEQPPDTASVIEQDAVSLSTVTEQPPDTASVIEQDTVSLPTFAEQQLLDTASVIEQDAVSLPTFAEQQPDPTSVIEQDAVSLPTFAEQQPLDTASVIEQDTVSLPTVTEQPDPTSVIEQDTISLTTFTDQSLDPFLALEQDTISFTTVNKSSSTHGKAGGLSMAIRQVIAIGLARLQEHQPEGLFTRGLQVVKPGANLGALPMLTFLNGLGLLIVSLSYYLSVLLYGSLALEFFFLLGLLFMFVPNLVRLLSPAPSRIERIYLLCILGLYYFLVEFMISPLHFSWFDDFLHWQTANEILRTGHLFWENAMLPVSPYYPGLEILTNAITAMTGLSSFYSAVVLISISRLLMVLALFLFYEQLTESSRMAGIAALIYMTNSHFLFFDAIYNYETLALPLATCVLYILTRYEIADKGHRRILLAAWIVLTALVITHHMTDYVFVGLLIFWAAVSLFRLASWSTRIHLIEIALFGLILSFMYAFLFPGNPVSGYLGTYFGSSFAELGHIVEGTHAARPLFSSQVVHPSPIWDRLLLLGSVAFVAFLLPLGLVTLWQRHRNNALAVTFGLVSLLYPISQAFRFTTLGGEITDRSAAFLFLPIAYVLTILITHLWPTRRLTWKATSLTVCMLSVVFLGGVVNEIGSIYQNLPGPYLVVGDVRSIEPEGIQAATWSLSHLGAYNHFATDRINQLLLHTYGDQRVITHLYDNVDVAPMFLSSTFNDEDIGILHAGRIHYLMVDLRLSTSLPIDEIYFENDRPTSVISRGALTKFNEVPQLMRVFDSGDIVIYDSGTFIAGPGQ